jgi:hypothetical protein
MARFNGLTDNQWRLIEGFFPEPAKKKREGKTPHAVESSCEYDLVDFNNRLQVV